MKIEVVLTAMDIRIAIDEWMQKHHTAMISGKQVSISFSSNDIKAVATIEERPGSNWGGDK